MATTKKQFLEFHPLTTDRWSDLEDLFGEHGACGGCWCMWWRLKRAEYGKQKGAGNKRAFRAIVNSGDVPGILAYSQGKPIAWCALAPRETYPVLERSRILKRVDDRPVWSVVSLRRPWIQTQGRFRAVAQIYQANNEM